MPRMGAVADMPAVIEEWKRLVLTRRKGVMCRLTTTAVVDDKHTLTVQVPADIAPGPKQIVIVLEDAAPMNTETRKLKLPPAHAVGPMDPSCTYRREDMYGDDGR
jgi:hypothetical protein